jgi:hypothetical protein
LIVELNDRGYGPFEATASQLREIPTRGLTIEFDPSAQIHSVDEPPQPPVPAYTRWEIRSSVLVTNRREFALMLLPGWFAIDLGDPIHPHNGEGGAPRMLRSGEYVRMNLAFSRPAHGPVPTRGTLEYAPSDNAVLVRHVVPLRP